MTIIEKIETTQRILEYDEVADKETVKVYLDLAKQKMLFRPAP